MVYEGLVVVAILLIASFPFAGAATARLEGLPQRLFRPVAFDRVTDRGGGAVRRRVRIRPLEAGRHAQEGHGCGAIDGFGLEGEDLVGAGDQTGLRSVCKQPALAPAGVIAERGGRGNWLVASPARTYLN